MHAGYLAQIVLLYMTTPFYASLHANIIFCTQTFVNLRAKRDLVMFIITGVCISLELHYVN